MVGSLNTGFYSSGSGDFGKNIKPDEDQASKQSNASDDDEFDFSSAAEKVDEGENDKTMANEERKEAESLAKEGALERTVKVSERQQASTQMERSANYGAKGERNITVSQSAGVLGANTLDRMGNETQELRNDPTVIANKLEGMKRQIEAMEEKLKVYDGAINDLENDKHSHMQAIKDIYVLHEGKLVQIHANNLDLAKKFKTHGAARDQSGKWQFHNPEHIDFIKQNKVKLVHANGNEQDLQHNDLSEFPPEGESRNEILSRMEAHNARLERLIEINTHLSVLTHKRQHLNNQVIILRQQYISLQEQLAQTQIQEKPRVLAPPGPKLTPSILKVDSNRHERTPEKPLPQYTQTPSLAHALKKMAEAEKASAHQWKQLLNATIESIREQHQAAKEVTLKKDALYFETLSNEIEKNNKTTEALHYEYDKLYHEDANNPNLIHLSREAFYLNAENLARIEILGAA